ncbi:MAG: peptidylprolyl isomerase [Thiobacillus sp.]|jgi:peptidylprolyl isomerase/peptidyl-prolyl cis-trans isomerase B (cyclophilin B)|uniref:peptidylprolyl isomerase n=1 Tax=Thiobacillus sp. TaxID=924 RepID=UPI00289488C9|nr:peptidylprolyl isomerase [Thiobacillus sp.]MDT3707884.1 peptidylprolyl isomerase [Thiobacillus sp.]
MTRLHHFLTTLFLGFMMLGISGCNASEPGTQSVSTAPAAGQPANPRVLIETSMGNITVELFPAQAPQTTANFLRYVKSGFYDGLMFHRVIPGFMIQGGGLMPDMSEKPNGSPIANEAYNGLKNLRGTLAMARTGDPHSATSQFFINVADNRLLDHRGKSVAGWGYAVFGKVVDGMAVVDAIVAVPRGSRGPHDDVPLEPVVMQRVSLLPEAPAPATPPKQ